MPGAEVVSAEPVNRIPFAMTRLALLAFCLLPVSVALAQPTSAAPKQKAKKEYREPTWLMPRVEGPNLHYRTFESRTAGQPVSYLIYLPEDYETDRARRYPVVYWLHGIGGSQQGVPTMAGRLTQAIRDKKTPPFIVVYVNGMVRSGYVDTADGKYPVETVTLKELIPHIDATYRTIARREGRMVEGFSMGGGGAAKWGFKHPDLFGSVSILAGALHTREEMERRNAGMAATYGTPEQFEQNNPWALVQANADRIRGRTTIRIAVGGKDRLAAANTRYHELLTKLGIAHAFDVVPDAIHSPNPVYDGLGDRNWDFYRKAFGGGL